MVADTTAQESEPAHIPAGNSPFSSTSSYSLYPLTASRKKPISPSNSYPFSYVNSLIFVITREGFDLGIPNETQAKSALTHGHNGGII